MSWYCMIRGFLESRVLCRVLSADCSESREILESVEDGEFEVLGTGQVESSAFYCG